MRMGVLSLSLEIRVGLPSKSSSIELKLSCVQVEKREPTVSRLSRLAVLLIKAR